MARRKALTVGAVVAGVAFALCCALFWLALVRNDASAGLGALILWPVLVPSLMGSVALGLWASHRLYRRSVAIRP